MSTPAPELFRKESLDRLASPERVDQLLRVADPRSWLPLGTAAGLLLVLLLWSILGTIPVYVEGQGLLVQPRRRVVLKAVGSGRLAAIDVAVGQTVAPGTVLGRLARPDLEQRLALGRERLADLEARREASRVLHERRTGVQSSSSRQLAASLEQHIERTEELATRMRRDRLAAIAVEQAALAEQQEVARRLVDSLAARVKGNRELHAAGMISRQALDQTEQEYADAQARLTSVVAGLHDLEIRRLQADEQYLDRLQRAADLTFSLHGLDVRQSELASDDLSTAEAYERELSAARVEVALAEQALAEQGRIVSQHAGRILELHAAAGEFLEAGDPLGTMEATDATGELMGVGYFRVRDGKRVEPGMPVRITPDTVERERYGGLLGRVTEVSPFPVTAQDVANVVGHGQLAEDLVRGGYLIQVTAELQRAGDSGALVWSARAPEIEITAGTTASARVAVEERRPITLLFPALKSTLGVD